MKKLLIIIMSMILMVPTIAQGTQSVTAQKLLPEHLFKEFSNVSIVTNAAVALVSCGLD